LIALKSVQGAFTMCQDFCVINMNFLRTCAFWPTKVPGGFSCAFSPQWLYRVGQLWRFSW